MTKVALAALALTVFLLGGCTPRGREAEMLLADITAGSGPSTLKDETPAPTRQAIGFQGSGARWRNGDLYLPGQAGSGALVLIPGAAREGKDDPRLVALANSLARVRFVVLVPDIPSLRAEEVSASDQEPILDAVNWLSKQYGNGVIGVGAISFAVGPAVLAAMRQPRIDMVIGIGGYYDITQVVTFFTTGYVRDTPGGPWVHREPNTYGKWVFVKSNARRLTSPEDATLLAAIADRKMADPDTPIADLNARLGPEGRAVMALLDNRDPERVPSLIEALPEEIRQQTAALDLSRRNLSHLHATLFLIHGRNDRIIPWSQSAELAAAAPSAELALPDNLAHANLEPGSLADTFALWRIIDTVLAERDRLAGRH